MTSAPADGLATVSMMTTPWSDIEDHYSRLVDGGLDVQGMLRLVEQIRASQYVRALHGWTSMHDLCIVQVPCTYPDCLPFLRVAPLFDGTIEFRYIDTLIEEKQWRRRVKECDAFQRLERFIDQVHWVVRERTAIA